MRRIAVVVLSLAPCGLRAGHVPPMRGEIRPAFVVAAPVAAPAPAPVVVPPSRARSRGTPGREPGG